MKLFPAKCHERATLRKRKQLPVTREMLTAVAGISARYSKFVFVLLVALTASAKKGTSLSLIDESYISKESEKPLESRYDQFISS